MVVYGYKPDTLVAVYPALQGTDAPRCNIFKNIAVYPADWLAENYRHYLKVRLIYQQLNGATCRTRQFCAPTPIHHYTNHHPTGAGGRNGL